jgi:hypothetical protein
MKRQRRRRKVPKTEVGSVQVPEYALDRLLMRSPWRCLKMSTQTYRELDVWPRRRQVEEWPDHTSVLLLVHVFTFEDHVWFEDRWMVASLCDEWLTTLCGLILG